MGFSSNKPWAGAAPAQPATPVALCRAQEPPPRDPILTRETKSLLLVLICPQHPLPPASSLCSGTSLPV